MLNPAEEDTECVQNEEGGLCLASSSLELTERLRTIELMWKSNKSALDKLEGKRRRKVSAKLRAFADNTSFWDSGWNTRLIKLFRCPSAKLRGSGILSRPREIFTKPSRPSRSSTCISGRMGQRPPHRNTKLTFLWIFSFSLLGAVYFKFAKEATGVQTFPELSKKLQPPPYCFPLDMPLQCGGCQKTYSRTSDFTKHEKNCEVIAMRNRRYDKIRRDSHKRRRHSPSSSERSHSYSSPRKRARRERTPEVIPIDKNSRFFIVLILIYLVRRR